MDNKPIVPGSAARATEESPITPNRKIEPGSAARISEQSESSAVPRGNFRATMSITSRAGSGAKFDVFGRPEGPGEALPQGYTPSASASSRTTETGNADRAAGENEPSVSGSPRNTLFRRLFGR